ncbi:MAG TPA: hypothetical protein PKC49_13695 [Phycisphaerae bacterium]|nr:hypothetical protein [Phycisphaerae bacterium]
MLMLLAWTLVASCDPDALTPCWTAHIGDGVEWCEALEDEAGSRLLVCTRAHALHLLDAGNGRPLTERPARVGRGARFAGHAAGRAYVFDRDIVYCFATSRHEAAAQAGRLLWSAGQAPAPTERRDADPEFLLQILAACLTDAGVVFARSDGRVGVLDAATGELRRSWQLPRLAHARLHGEGATVGLVAVAEGSGLASVWPADAPRPPARLALSRSAPTWSAIAAGRLALLWPDEVRLVGADGSDRSARAPSGRFMAGAAQAVVLRGGEGAGPAVWLGRDDGGISRVDGAGVATQPLADPPRAAVTHLRAGRDVVICAAGDELRLWNAADGRAVAGERLPPRSGIVALHAAGSRAFALRRAAVGQPAEIPTEYALLWCDAESRGAPGGERRFRGARLAEAGEATSAAWMRDRLVLIERGALRVYRLPE